MKKFNLLLAIAAIFTAIGFSSCDNKGKDPGEDDNTDTIPADAVKVDAAKAYYLGHNFTYYTDCFSYIFCGEGVEVLDDGTFTGTGQALYIDLLADVKGSGATAFPAAGDYKVSLDAVVGNTLLISLFENGVALPSFQDAAGQTYGCYVLNIEDGKTTSSAYADEGSVITISGDAANGRMIMKLVVIDKDKNQSNANFVFEGSMTVDDSMYDDGSTPFTAEADAPGADFVMTSIEGGVMQEDMYDKGVDLMSISMTNEKNEVVSLSYYVATGAEPYGTFTLGHKMEPGVAECSMGIMDAEGTLMAPFAGVTDASGESLEKVWFPIEGSFTVSAEGVTFDLKSFKGSTIKGSYTGAVSFGTSSVAAPKFILK